MQDQIQYVKRTDIDTVKWNLCVNESTNGLIYSQSFFLDQLCEWDALMTDDYDTIMPLPKRKKAGIQYIYTPTFIGQLGVTSRKSLTAAICRKFIEAIPAQFYYINLRMNEWNVTDELTEIHVHKRVNLILPLQKTYEELYCEFSKDGRKNIRRAESHRLSIREHVTAGEITNLYRSAYGARLRKSQINDLAAFENLITIAVSTKKGFTIGVTNNRNETIAAGFFGIDGKRIYYLLAAPNEEGRKKKAVHFMLNEIMKRFAGSGLVFDFEGSDIASIATFYKKFNPSPKTYSEISINRLPFLLKWLKK